MSRFLANFHHTHHDDKYKYDTASASASSGRTSRDSKQPLAQCPSPPPYTQASTKQPYQTDAGFAASYSSSRSDGKGTDYPGPSTVRTSLQVCPHENLTFERLQSLKGILYERNLKKGKDIIKNTKEKQHEVILDPDEAWPVDIWACHADNKHGLTTGTFKLKLNSKPHKFFGHTKGPAIGLELHVWWMLHVWSASGNSRDKINQFLQNFDNVQLCPHTLMNDPWVQETVYNFLTVREIPKPSSMDNYMQYTHKSKPPPAQPPQSDDCDRCNTHVEVSYKPSEVCDVIFVKTTRHLGEGVVENDPTWLAQCGIEP